MTAIRVLIADDEPLVRGGLSLVVNAADDLTVVGEAASGPETLAQTSHLTPDVVLLDIQMPGSDGIAVTRALHARPRDARASSSSPPSASTATCTRRCRPERTASS